MEKEYCICCGEELCCLDDDPNGEKNAICARCREEDEHDFDADPTAKFNRSGERINEIFP